MFSAMLRVWVGSRGVLFCLWSSVVACSSTSANGVSCGAGTALQGKECVVANGGAGGSATLPGNAGTSGRSMTSGAAGEAGVDTEAGSGGRAGSPEGEAGDNALGGSSGSFTGGSSGTSTGGSSGTSTGGGTGGGGGVGGSSFTHRWLAFNQDAAYVYDTTKFPDVDAAVSIGNGTVGPWSPDGRKLIFGNKGVLYASDMTDATPGTAVLLVAVPGLPSQSLGFSVSNINWLGDSRSIATVVGTTLSTFDASLAAPPIHSITSTLTSLSLSPANAKLVYRDGTGTFLVNITAGTPGSSVAVDAGTNIVWAPNGLAFASVKSGNLYLTDVSGATPVTSSLTTAATGSPSVVNPVFSPNGDKLVFYGNQDRTEPDVYVVDLHGAPGNIKRVNPALSATGSASVCCSYVSPWSADSKWLLYGSNDTSNAAATGLFIVDLSGSTPGAPVQFKGANYFNAWAPGDLVFGSNNGGLTFLQFNPQTPATDPKTLFTTAAASNPTLNHAATAFAYVTKYDLYLADAVNPNTTPTDVPLDGGYDAVGTFGWSSDSKFVAVVDNLTSYLTPQYRVRLLRVDGVTPSTPVNIHAQSTNYVHLAWQP